MKQIRYIVLDVDGTLTDGGLYIDFEGRDSKRFCVQDGAGIMVAHRAGLQFIIITGRTSASTRCRAEELGIAHIHQNVKDKYSFLRDMMSQLGITQQQLGYIGDDLNDLHAMKLAGFVGCPSNAAPEVKAVCHYVSPVQGGYGAVRDVLEYLLRQRGEWEPGVQTTFR